MDFYLFVADIVVHAERPNATFQMQQKIYNKLMMQSNCRCNTWTLD